jgi:hypothetical protein
MAVGSRQLAENWSGFSVSLYGSGVGSCRTMVALSRIYAATVAASAWDTFGCKPKAKMLSTKLITERMERVHFVQESASQNRP